MIVDVWAPWRAAEVTTVSHRVPATQFRGGNTLKHKLRTVMTKISVLFATHDFNYNQSNHYYYYILNITDTQC